MVVVGGGGLRILYGYASPFREKRSRWTGPVGGLDSSKKRQTGERERGSEGASEEMRGRTS